MEKLLKSFSDHTLKNIPSHDKNALSICKDVMERLNLILTTSGYHYNFVIHNLRDDYEISVVGLKGYESFDIGEMKYGIWVFESGTFSYTGSAKRNICVGGHSRGSFIEVYNPPLKGLLTFTKPEVGIEERKGKLLKFCPNK